MRSEAQQPGRKANMSMFSGAEFAAQVGRIREAMRPLVTAVENLGSGEAAYADLDNYDREVLRQLAGELEVLVETLRDMADQAPSDDE